MKTCRPRPCIPESLAVALCLALAACTGPAPPAGGSPTSAAAAAPSQAAAVQLAGVSADDLRKRAQLALREQRLFSPAGDNAIEYYVALRGRSATADADAQGALMELQPYAVIGAEQALAHGDLAEADRLRRLVAAIDPAAPSLGRIAQAIAAEVDARAQQALDTTAAAEALARTEPAPEESPPALSSTPAPMPEPPTTSQAPGTVPAPVAVAPLAAPNPAPQATPAPATTPAPGRIVASRPLPELIPVRTPPPEFPNDKQRSGKSGQIVASFTVLSDGTVGNIDLESVGARHIAFERSVLQALKRWKYQPPGEERSVRMNFAFQN